MFSVNGGSVGPTRRQLRAIEAEWPQIAHELEIVEAETAIAEAEGLISSRGRNVSELDWARLRAAEASLNNLARSVYNVGGSLDGAA